MTHESYEALLHFPSDPVSEGDPRFRALQRAYSLRMLEIDLYWKRSTYFWILQGSVFAALGLTSKGQGNDAKTELLMISLGCIGILSALAGHISARGSKFWQQNWEMHIDRLEDYSEGKLYKSLWLPGGKVSWSVTRVNDVLTIGFTLFWTIATLLLYGAMFEYNWVAPIGIDPIDGKRTAILTIVAGTMFLALQMARQKSGTSYKLRTESYFHLDANATFQIRSIAANTVGEADGIQEELTPPA